MTIEREKLTFKQRLEKTGLALMRAAFAGAIAVLTGAAWVANADGNKALGTALLIGAGVGALRFIQTLIPGMTFGTIMSRFGLDAYVATVDTFAAAFASSLVVFGIGAVQTPQEGFTRAALSAAVVGAINGATRAVQGNSK